MQTGTTFTLGIKLDDHPFITNKSDSELTERNHPDVRIYIQEENKENNSDSYD